MTPTEAKTTAEEVRRLIDNKQHVSANILLNAMCRDFVRWASGTAVFSQQSNVRRVAQTIVGMFSDETEIVSTTPRDGFKTGRVP